MTDSFRYIESYVHEGGIGVLVELDVSDPAARKSESFILLAKDLAMHIAAMAPTSVEDLLGQPSVAETGLAVDALIAQAAEELHLEITVRRFVRWLANEHEAVGPHPPKSPAVIQDQRAAR